MENQNSVDIEPEKDEQIPVEETKDVVDPLNLPKPIHTPQVIPNDLIKNMTPRGEILEGQVRLCSHHGLVLEIYCDSCEEPICQQCIIMGPHNTQVNIHLALFCNILYCFQAL